MDRLYVMWATIYRLERRIILILPHIVYCRSISCSIISQMAIRFRMEYIFRQRNTLTSICPTTIDVLFLILPQFSDCGIFYWRELAGAFLAQDAGDGAEENLNIEGDGPVLDIINIESTAFVEGRVPHARFVSEHFSFLTT